VLLVRGTKKVLDRADGPTASAGDRSTTRLGDWYVNVLFWRPQVALFVSDATLLPVLVPFGLHQEVVEARRPCDAHSSVVAACRRRAGILGG